MAGGDGNDVYYVDNASDQVVELVDGGVDQVFASVTFSLAGGHVENLTLTALRRSTEPATRSPTSSPAMRRLTSSTAAKAPTPWRAAPAATPITSTISTTG